MGWLGKFRHHSLVDDVSGRGSINFNWLITFSFNLGNWGQISEVGQTLLQHLKESKNKKERKAIENYNKIMKKKEEEEFLKIFQLLPPSPFVNLIF